eukprot:s1163_g18.t1
MTLAGLNLDPRPLLRQRLQDIQNKPITLQEACFKGDLKTLEDSLTAAGGSIDEKDAKGISCLGYAIGANRTHVVKKLLENKANAAEVDTSGGNALHYAAAYGRKELCDYFLKAKLDVNKQNTQGQTPLALAQKNKMKAAAKSGANWKDIAGRLQRKHMRPLTCCRKLVPLPEVLGIPRALMRVGLVAMVGRDAPCRRKTAVGSNPRRGWCGVVAVWRRIFAVEKKAMTSFRGGQWSSSRLQVLSVLAATAGVMTSLAVVVAVAFLGRAAGHGWMTMPPARNAVAGDKNGYCPHCGNGNGICGDGGQWPSGSNYVNAGVTPSGPEMTLTAGSIHEVEIKITAHHKGHFEFSICDKEITSSLSNAQSCLDEHILLRASAQELGITDCQPNDRRPGCQPMDPNHPERFYLPPSGFSPDGSDTHKISVKIPAGLQCQHCTLQWRWWSANSCIPGTDYGCYADVLFNNGYNPSDWFNAIACPGGGCTRCGCGEEFRNCADVKVVAGSGTTATTTAGTATTTTTTTTVMTSTTGTTTSRSGGSPPTCVSQETLICINSKSTYWPKCVESQAKNTVGPSGYEFGHYCTQAWTDSLNEMLSHPAIDKCSDYHAIHKLLAQVAYETGYYSTVYQPRDGGAGLIHMIPNNWPYNGRDMDILFGNQNYKTLVNTMGQTFFQTAQYGWRSVAAWFKLTNSVIPGCGDDLFNKTFEEQTKCILGYTNDRSEAYDLVGSCLGSASTEAPTTTAPTTGAPTTTTAPTTQTTSTQAAGCRAAVNALGATDERCRLACAQLPSGAWPCAGQLCDCEGGTSATTTAMTTAPPTTTTTTTTTSQSGSMTCVPTEGLPPNGATPEYCQRCAEGYKWWPCNTDPAICTCTTSI